MPSPDQERMDALSDAIAGVLRRQREIDSRLARLERALGVTATQPESPGPEPSLPQPVVPEPAAPQPPGQPAAPPEPAAHTPPPAPRSPFETRMGLTLLNRAGVVTLVLGVLFFFKYAVDNQWIGETGRIILGVLAGFAALGAGDYFWRRSQRTFAQGISGCGIAILYVSFYASFGFYRVLPQEVAFLLMALNTAVAGVLAMRYNARAIAALGLVGGYLTPVLLSTGENRPWVLFSYVLLLDAGALWVSRRRAWRLLDGLAGAATFLLYFSWLVSGLSPEDRFVGTFFAFVFYAFFVTRELRPVVAGAQLLTPLALVIAHGSNGIPIVPLLVPLFAGLYIANRRGWPESPAFAFASFWLAYATRHSRLLDSPGTVVFGLLTIAFLAVLLWVPLRTAVHSAAARSVDLVVLVLNSAVFFGFSYDLLERRYRGWLGLFAAGVAALHFAVAGRPWSRSFRDTRAILLYTGIALSFLTLAIPIQFAGYRITMAWALEGAALAWIGSRLSRHLTKASFVVLALAWLRLLAIDAHLYGDPRAYSALLNIRFLTFATTAVALWLAARWSRPERVALAPYVAGHFTLLWGLILEVIGWASRTAPPGEAGSVESTSVSILLAAYSVLLVAIGVRTRTVVNRILGLGLIALVVLKLYLYDVWQIGRIYRVAAFAGLGAFLLLTSFLYSRFRSSIESWWRDEETSG